MDTVKDYDHFLAMAADTFVQKDTDYESRFMRGLLELDGRTIWAWEVDKKLDRLRSWIDRGELQVKGEGIENSVQDLFVYTVQYVTFVDIVINGSLTSSEAWGWFMNEFKPKKEKLFYYKAARLNAWEWVEFLEKKERIAPNEHELKKLIRGYMIGEYRG